MSNLQPTLDADNIYIEEDFSVMEDTINYE